MQGSRCIRNIMVPCNMGPQGSDIPLSVSYRYHLHVSGHVYILGGGDRVSYVGNPGNSASGRSEGMLADIRALFKDNVRTIEEPAVTLRTNLHYLVSSWR